jgi:putative membrane protein insertion efficiency factor
MSIVHVISGAQASCRPPFDAGPDARASRFAALRIAGWKIVQFVLRLPAHALLLLIRIYQRTLSPALPIIFGSACGCRFAPSCSHYAAGAIQTHGVIAGVTLAVIRLVKCTPLHPGGFDPVPPRRSRPRCERFTA